MVRGMLGCLRRRNQQTNGVTGGRSTCHEQHPLHSVSARRRVPRTSESFHTPFFVKMEIL